MLKKKIFLAASSLAIVLLTSQSVDAQDSTKAEKKTTFSGSIDAYYRYNFHNAKSSGSTNNYTSFTNSQNSFELGMASLKVEHSFGRGVTGVLDLGVGNRAEEFSYNDKVTSLAPGGGTTSSPTLLAAVKQAYVSYAPSSKVKFTMGKFGTHVGYELLDPQLNKNYSMSYMFSYGPFFHTGLKADFTLSDNFSFMVGVANPTDYSTASFAKKVFLGQLHGATDDGSLSAYLNYVGGKDDADVSSNQFDLVVTASLADNFSLGYNGTYKSLKFDASDKASFWGSAVYLTYDASSKFGVTLRGEYFDDAKGGTGLLETKIFAGTLSGNIKMGPLTIIPEFRFDSAKDAIFAEHDGASAKGSFGGLLAAVLSF